MKSYIVYHALEYVCSSTASVREKKQLQSPTVHHVYSYNSYTVYYTILLHHSKAAPLAAERCHGSAAAIHREMGHHRKNSTLAELVFHCLKQIRKPSKVRHTDVGHEGQNQFFDLKKRKINHSY